MVDSTDYTLLSIENLEILASFDDDAAYEIHMREEHELNQGVFLEHLEVQDENCNPEKGICYCGLCIDDRLENDDSEPTQVWFTESPGGHNGWE